MKLDNRVSVIASLRAGLLCCTRGLYGSIADARSQLYLIAVALVLASSTNVHAADSAFGVGVHSIMKTVDVQRSELSIAAGLGFDSVRTDAQWKYVETSKGHLAIPASWDSFVDEATQRGLKPILILDYGNPLYDGGDKPRSSEALQAFSRYAAFVVGHFKGRVKIYEIWNEWDNTTGGFPAGSPDDYAQLFKAAAPAVRKADPLATVLLSSGIKQGWYEQLADLGLVGESDGVSVHPYNYEPILAPETSAQALIKLESALASKSGKKVDIYVTEIGWPTHFGLRGYDPARVADFAVRAPLLISSLPFVKGIWWYDLIDDGNDLLDKQHHFGLVQTDHSPKAATNSIPVVAKLLKHYDLNFASESQLQDGQVAILARPKSSDGEALITWNLGHASRSFNVGCSQGASPRLQTDSSDGHGVKPSANPMLVTGGYHKCDVRSLEAFGP